LASRGRIVMVGRDIGTVVLPDAERKIFLTASAAERARRREEELAARGEHRPRPELLAEILHRDELDSHRAVAPLRAAHGAMIVITNHVNWKDPPWIKFALGRAIRYMAKRELFAVPVIGFVLRGIGCFPVRRGEADRGALAIALSVLAAGQPLGYFPEG